MVPNDINKRPRLLQNDRFKNNWTVIKTGAKQTQFLFSVYFFTINKLSVTSGLAGQSDICWHCAGILPLPTFTLSKVL